MWREQQAHSREGGRGSDFRKLSLAPWSSFKESRLPSLFYGWMRIRITVSFPCSKGMRVKFIFSSLWIKLASPTSFMNLSPQSEKFLSPLLLVASHFWTALLKSFVLLGSGFNEYVVPHILILTTLGWRKCTRIPKDLQSGVQLHSWISTSLVSLVEVFGQDLRTFLPCPRVF